jgi:hypothetical protein
MDIKKHADLADIMWGSDYYDVIPSIINNFNLKIVAEVGVAFGGHLEKILSTTNIEEVYAIDPYILFDSSTDSFSYQGVKYNQQDYDELFLFTKERLENINKKVTFFRDTSINASIKIKDDYLDIVFIDAEHTFEALKKDLEIWECKVKTGGIISGHDYNHGNFPDVKKVIDAWVSEKNYELNIEKGYVWWVIKKDKI